ncbi:N-acetylmuramoyl-L-alanine amidase family protein [Bacillus mycoides]|uniref:N-acetylmuramoyl-L-alanine amidase family protein n=1 Tax=Bacillus mycoides TaxID=1405 RepID=UPI00119E2543|nr:N-acetylmuramoyl-L-alanine amidase family protein [Bacillus mycoides]
MKKAVCKFLATAVALQVVMSPTPSFAAQEQGVAEQSSVVQGEKSAKQAGSWEKWWNWGGARYDWYFKRSDGGWHKGWLEHNNKLYYLNRHGEMLEGSQEIEGISYKFDNTGALIPTGTGMLLKGENDTPSYYLSSNGTIQTGFQQYNGVTYFFCSDGAMKTGWQQIDGKSYYFNENGERHIGWISDGGSRKYLKDDGTFLKDVQEIDGKSYFFDDSGVMKTGWVKIRKRRSVGPEAYYTLTYYFDNNGVMKIGWQEIDNKKYFFSYSDGVMLTGRQYIHGKLYFFDSNGVMQQDRRFGPWHHWG